MLGHKGDLTQKGKQALPVPEGRLPHTSLFPELGEALTRQRPPWKKQRYNVSAQTQPRRAACSRLRNGHLQWPFVLQEGGRLILHRKFMMSRPLFPVEEATFCSDPWDVTPRTLADRTRLELKPDRELGRKLRAGSGRFRVYLRKVRLFHYFHTVY